MSGYTKGPWEWWTSNSFLRLSSKATGKDGSVIDSYVMSDGHSSLSVTYADMALIAAAPELLEALQCLKRELVLSDVDLAYIESHFRPHIDRARAAIAKALGQ
ncbi:hypothetical protein [Pantoea sp.]|uniref:hypothetical protein n=1 Tax=Pantoea sp. TaxID=69393 RepID=UPI0028B03513|nr:hypothetical protein [Pantoea sp.]